MIQTHVDKKNERITPIYGKFRNYFFLKSSVLTCVAMSKGAYSTDSFYSNTKDIFLTNKLFPSKKK